MMQDRHLCWPHTFSLAPQWSPDFSNSGIATAIVTVFISCCAVSPISLAVSPGISLVLLVPFKNVSNFSQYSSAEYFALCIIYSISKFTI